MTHEHPHPGYHAEALALVGGDMPRVVAVSWALADAAHRSVGNGGGEVKQSLYIQPMTARDAAFAEGFTRGREEGVRAGVRMAATALSDSASTVAGHGAASDTVADSLAFVAGMLRDLAGRL